MTFQIHITRDYQQLSHVAATYATGVIGAEQRRERDVVLGLATGNSPVGLYKHLAKAFNSGAIDARRVRTFNLDEYVGLPGANAQERTLHPESYSFFMTTHLFGLVWPRLRETGVPPGNLIDQGALVAALGGGTGFTMAGSDAGRAVVIDPDADGVLGWIRDELLAGYAERIRAAGGVDLHVIGVGGRGHVAFHESGIPFDTPDVLLVKLDDNTVQNAVTDEHFESPDDSPLYATSMGTRFVFEAKRVLMVANGARKTGPVTEAVLGEVTADVPLSYGQRYVADGGELVFVLDEAAAAGLLERADEVVGRGFEIVDHRGEPCPPLTDLTFAWSPEAGTLV